jgi:hypothetical protein
VRHSNLDCSHPAHPAPARASQRPAFNQVNVICPPIMGHIGHSLLGQRGRALANRFEFQAMLRKNVTLGTAGKQVILLTRRGRYLEQLQEGRGSQIDARACPCCIRSRSLISDISSSLPEDSLSVEPLARNIDTPSTFIVDIFLHSSSAPHHHARSAVHHHPTPSAIASCLDDRSLSQPQRVSRGHV